MHICDNKGLQYFFKYSLAGACYRSENAVPLNLTSKMENNALQASPSAIPVSVISETSVKSEV